jgi:hypothetical protein
MNARQVCTSPTNYGRIVSSNPKALGASTSSRRIRREENHFIFVVATNYHLCAMNLHGRKMLTLHLQLLDLALFNLFYPFSRTILERSESPAHSSYKLIVEPRRRHPVVKAVIVPKSEWAVVTLINLFYCLTAGSILYSVLSQSFRLSFAPFVLFVVNPLLKSAFRNRLCAHERPVYRHCFSRQRTAIKWAPILQDLGSQLSRIIGFEISPNSDGDRRFVSPWGRVMSNFLATPQVQFKSAPRFALANVSLGEQIRGGLGKPFRIPQSAIRNPQSPGALIL